MAAKLVHPEDPAAHPLLKGGLAEHVDPARYAKMRATTNPNTQRGQLKRIVDDATADKAAADAGQPTKSQVKASTAADKAAKTDAATQDAATPRPGASLANAVPIHVALAHPDFKAPSTFPQLKDTPRGDSRETAAAMGKRGAVAPAEETSPVLTAVDRRNRTRFSPVGSGRGPTPAGYDPNPGYIVNSKKAKARKPGAVTTRRIGDPAPAPEADRAAEVLNAGVHGTREEATGALNELISKTTDTHVEVRPWGNDKALDAVQVPKENLHKTLAGMTGSRHVWVSAAHPTEPGKVIGAMLQQRPHQSGGGFGLAGPMVTADAQVPGGAVKQPIIGQRNTRGTRAEGAGVTPTEADVPEGSSDRFRRRVSQNLDTARGRKARKLAGEVPTDYHDHPYVKAARDLMAGTNAEANEHVLGELIDEHVARGGDPDDVQDVVHNWSKQLENPAEFGEIHAAKLARYHAVTQPTLGTKPGHILEPGRDGQAPYERPGTRDELDRATAVKHALDSVAQPMHEAAAAAELARSAVGTTGEPTESVAGAAGGERKPVVTRPPTVAEMARASAAHSGYVATASPHAEGQTEQQAKTQQAILDYHHFATGNESSIHGGTKGPVPDDARTASAIARWSPVHKALQDAYAGKGSKDKAAALLAKRAGIEHNPNDTAADMQAKAEARQLEHWTAVGATRKPVTTIGNSGSGEGFGTTNNSRAKAARAHMRSGEVMSAEDQAREERIQVHMTSAPAVKAVKHPETGEVLEEARPERPAVDRKTAEARVNAEDDAALHQHWSEHYRNQGQRPKQAAALATEHVTAHQFARDQGLKTTTQYLGHTPSPAADDEPDQENEPPADATIGREPVRVSSAFGDQSAPKAEPTKGSQSPRFGGELDPEEKAEEEEEKAREKARKRAESQDEQTSDLNEGRVDSGEESGRVRDAEGNLVEADYHAPESQAGRGDATVPETGGRHYSLVGVAEQVRSPEAAARQAQRQTIRERGAAALPEGRRNRGVFGRGDWRTGAASIPQRDPVVSARQSRMAAPPEPVSDEERARVRAEYEAKAAEREATGKAVLNARPVEGETPTPPEELNRRLRGPGAGVTLTAPGGDDYEESHHTRNLLDRPTVAAQQYVPPSGSTPPAVAVQQAMMGGPVRRRPRQTPVANAAVKRDLAEASVGAAAPRTLGRQF